MLGANSKSNKKEAANSMQQRNVKAENKDSHDGGLAAFPPPFGSPSGALVAAAKQSNSEYHDAKSGPLSPNPAASPLNRGLNPKAEALAEAHRGRVEAEAQAYLERKLRDRGCMKKQKPWKLENGRRSGLSNLFRMLRYIPVKSKVKADKILSRAREDAHRIKAHASEQTEKAIADAYTRAERWKAEIEETKKKDLAEITDRVHLMVAIGELPSAQEHKGVVQRMKQSWACHP
eukprot:Gb_08548 [translate_table: standard]